MFSHIMVGANDVAESRRFYDAIFAALGVAPGTAIKEDRIAWMTDKGRFLITAPINGDPATFANGGTIAFNAGSPEQIDAWHAAGISAGGTTCEDSPGPRSRGPAGAYYLAYLRDPTGNKLCALHHL